MRRGRQYRGIGLQIGRNEIFTGKPRHKQG